MINDKRIKRIDDSLSRKQPTLQIMLDNVHSSQNLSAIIRSCDAVGVLDIYYSNKENESLRIHKTITQGAHRWTHRYRMNNDDKVNFLKEKKAQGFQVVVTHLEERAVSFRKIDYTKPTLLVMGNEKEGFTNNYTLIDTVRCAKHLLPDSPYHRLQYLRYSLELYKTEQAEAHKLGITIKAHDAIGDVLVMKLLLSKLVQLTQENFPGVNPMQKMAELTQIPVMMKTFKFGKYKGREIEDIAKEDMGYMKWMRKNLELDEDMTFTLDSYLG